jgi:hypothetical protein
MYMFILYVRANRFKSKNSVVSGEGDLGRAFRLTAERHLCQIFAICKSMGKQNKIVSSQFDMIYACCWLKSRYYKRYVETEIMEK